MKTFAATLLIAAVSIFAFADTAAAQSYSKVVRQSCKADYKKYCRQYGLNSPSLRSCMDRAGKRLSKACVRALVKAGEVSQAEVDRRRR